MAIEALYPSRRQPQKNNPLFARERRQRRMLAMMVVGAGVMGLVGLRIMPGEASAQDRIPVVHAAVAGTAVPVDVAAPKHNVRVIQIYSVPTE